MAVKMLILRGVAGNYAGRHWPKGALFEEPAIEYARRKGYIGEVLDIAGEVGPKKPQTLTALRSIRSDQSVRALYGFSGGGYNVFWILRSLLLEERTRIRLVVVIGSPKCSELAYAGPWELVYRKDPAFPKEHMDGPQLLLDETSRVGDFVVPTGGLTA